MPWLDDDDWIKKKKQQQKPKPATDAKISPKWGNPTDLARNTEEGEDEDTGGGGAADDAVGVADVDVEKVPLLLPSADTVDADDVEQARGGGVSVVTDVML